MRVVYCIRSTFNSGGMENVLCNKANYLVTHYGYEVYIITTDQYGKKNFFHFSPEIRFIDLAINYDDDRHKNLLRRGIAYIKKNKIHKQKLEKLLCRIMADIVVSMWHEDMSFLWKLKDGSKKIVEIHFSRYFDIIRHENQGAILGGLFKVKTLMERCWARNFNRFVILTEEDRKYWGKMRNLRVIPNACWFEQKGRSKLNQKKVISVGRLSYQKGVDYLLDVWKIVHERCPEWSLYHYGDGELYSMLHDKVKQMDLSDSLFIQGPTKCVQQKYLESSVFVMTSRYEGMPMAMLEAISCGLPVVAFSCQCGPRDIIVDGQEGMLVEVGDVKGLADSLVNLLQNHDLMCKMGESAFRRSANFAPDVIMGQWNDLFCEILSE